MKIPFFLWIGLFIGCILALASAILIHNPFLYMLPSMAGTFLGASIVLIVGLREGKIKWAGDLE